ncbi:MAG: hybrid sensor histidine kinase/response regulator [Sandaracinaceae bacterium]|jgi:signal transduction histidine kinase|nr:hybrid sensor histidine kinase/response regulator [Sandaracinaceae bacterium]MBP7684313.1 hybrid sensor histidine kinase/response regulator [Deltaproteobacteria bacterium]MBK6808833.1 hybrid sensor histidine kinase/response regulator [Sandaracinaceae bacterium]MBK7150403.1 hybrid sensor histidine kinase/response regulator [Sandaracinaceae bacterium]MBK7777259.1 hybrid sensor histidine kinase/response regulator [Sandaracinaceae bacterium]
MATILHIEDDPVNRRLVTKLLSAAGHTVVDAATGLEGIRIAAELVPDLILVDINIPDLDGYEVTLRLRGIPSLATTPIVAITAEGDRETSLAVGCDGFFGKPIDARVFARRIERFIGGKRERGDQASGEARLREKSQQIVARLEAKVRELSEANARLEEMARLRREFLRNVTHELATPMTPVVGYLRLLHNQDLGPLSAAQHKCVEAMTTSTDRLRAVVDLLLDVSTFESGNMQFNTRAFDFLAVAREAVNEVRGLADSLNVELVQEPAATGPAALGDADKIRRAMVHVLDNAVKFSPPHGQVCVAVRPVPGVGSDGLAPRGYAFLVADDGPGVQSAQIERVFEPFYQADGSRTRRHQGVGLGLAFARRVFEAHGGTVTMQSPPTEDVAGQRSRGALVRLVALREGSAAGARGGS